MITVIIDLLTSMVHLVPSRQDIRAREVAELVFEHVYKHHGLPRSIVSDRDALFTSQFWVHLHALMGVDLKMSSAFHPQTDGATERANRTITQMLRQCVSNDQKDWVSKLPAIEFALNSARSESTGFAPFFLNTGRMPRSMILDAGGSSEYPGVRFSPKTRSRAHDSILAARVKQTRLANRKRRPTPFIEGDLVYISTKNLSLPKGRARKLFSKYIGPYPIEKSFGNNSFRVQLPPELSRRGVHPVYHSSQALLRIHVPSDDRLFPGRLAPQVANLDLDPKEWQVDRITSHRGKGREAEFEIRWKAGDTTWISYDDALALDALQDYCEALGVGTPGELPMGKSPPSDSSRSWDLFQLI
jgi:hypothetical protein